MAPQNKTLDKIECPQCGASIPITETLQNQLAASIKKEYETKDSQREKEFLAREKELKKKEGEIAEARQAIDKSVHEKLKIEKTKIESAAKIKAREDLSVELKDLREQNQEQKEKLRKAEETELAMRKKARELEDREKSLALEVERKISAEKQKIEEDTAKRLSEEHRLKDLEKDKQINDLKKLTEELKRKAEQGSQQTQGEVLELELEKLLKDNFPYDEIVPVPKGRNGADVIQKVCNNSGRNCGQIAWESKKTKAWSEGWIQKLKDDQRAAKADLAVIVSAVLPADVRGFVFRNGVFICDMKFVINLSSLLRYDLIRVAEANMALVGREKKETKVYAYINSVEFKQKIQTIAEAFIEMNEDIEKERRAYQAIWAKRAKQVQRVIDNTFGIYGDLKGLTGGTLQEIKMFELASGEDSEKNKNKNSKNQIN